jgi:hypothetical protein
MLGGVITSAVTAAAGVVAVPGWVDAAYDAAAVNDLASVASAQGVSMSEGAGFLSLAPFSTRRHT